jgi:hypothetical protein
LVPIPTQSDFRGIRRKIIGFGLAAVLYTPQSALAACDGNTAGTSVCSGTDATVTVGATGNLDLRFNNQTVTTGGVTIDSGANPFDPSLSVVSASGRCRL